VKRPPEEPPQLVRREQPGRIRAVLLALIVHAAFFALIVFGVSWQVRPTPPVSAELWSQLPPAKAEKQPPPEPKPEPPRPEPPKPEPPKPEPPKPEPAKPEPPKPEPVKPEPPKPDPEIALKAEREKKEREKKERLEAEKRERDKRERLEKQKQDEAKKKREQEEAAKKKREDDKRRAEEEIARKEAERLREAAAAARKTEFDSWVGKIRDKVRGRANVPDTVTGQPEITVRIRILPGGEVLDIQVTKRSGNPAYDAAIERAIRSASPLPVPPANSELFPQFRDLNLQIRHER
jgi:colicin import membrane protein